MRNAGQPRISYFYHVLFVVIVESGIPSCIECSVETIDGSPGSHYEAMFV